MGCLLLTNSVQGKVGRLRTCALSGGAATTASGGRKGSEARLNVHSGWRQFSAEDHVGLKEGSTQLTPDASSAWIGQSHELLQTEGLAPGVWSGAGLWPAPSQPQLWGKKSCMREALPNHLNEKTEISDTPSCLFKMTMFLLVLK